MDNEYDELDFSQAQKLVKSRQRFHRRPKKTADVLAKLMARKGYVQTESAGELETVWNSIVGPKWQSKTKIGNLSRGVLEVNVASSMVNQQLAFQKRKILSQLQQQLPQNNFKDLRFRIGNVD
ncbi:MAG: DUF721 domain-containing protein [Mariniblastus sp.]|nr:DUF721 domain-containing protein [Mariniblastus sp.]